MKRPKIRANITIKLDIPNTKISEQPHEVFYLKFAKPVLHFLEENTRIKIQSNYECRRHDTPVKPRV